MELPTRDHSVAALAMLGGAAAIGFGALQPWAVRSTEVPVARSTRYTYLGFDELLARTGTHEDVRPLIVGGAVVLAFMGLLLLFTHIPRVGVLWRIAGLAAVTGTGAIGLSAWEVVKDPPLVVATSESAAGAASGAVTSTAQFGSLVASLPGPGLWLLTIGCGAAAVGALIPARRTRPFTRPRKRRLPAAR